METTLGSHVSAETCDCGRLPFRHVHLTIDYARYHPIFSRKGIVLAAERDDSGLTEEEQNEVRTYAREINLPDTHPFDIAVPHLVEEDPDDCEDDEEDGGDNGEDPDEEGRATFKMCPFCGQHGVLLNDEGQTLSQPVTKQEALRDLSEFIARGMIGIQDTRRVREQILDSPLRERDMIDSDEDESETDEDLDDDD